MNPANDQDRTWAALAHVSALLGFAPWGPLVVWAVFKDKSPYIAYHAMQALLFQMGAFAIILTVGLVTCGFGTLLLFPFFMAEAYVAYLCYEGTFHGYPLISGVGRSPGGEQIGEGGAG